ncbi:MAG TPA: ThiF family adenylyltransferase [Microterricola sp.]
MPLPPLVSPGAPLTADQARRYSRQLLLAQIGELGQRRLLAARVCVIGAGGLGAPALLYLAAAGVGTLGIVDDDVVETSNLQRQVIHGEGDVGRPKTASAAESISRLASSVQVITHSERLTTANARSVLGGYDLVLDGSDNFATRYLVADTCAELGLPVVWASVLRFDAQVSVFWSTPPADSGVAGVQLRDLFAVQPTDEGVESCESAGVLGALCGQVGSIMAAEAVKLITGSGDSLLGRVLVLDALTARWTELPLLPSRTDDGAVHPPVLARTVETDAAPSPPGELSAEQLDRRLSARERGIDDFLLVDVREPREHAGGAIDGSVLLPLAGLVSETGRSGIARDTPVIVYCQFGARARQAALALAGDGFESVTVLHGGYAGWPQRGSEAAAVVTE